MKITQGKLVIGCCFFLFSRLVLSAQTDAFCGTWQMQSLINTPKQTVQVLLEIAEPEDNLLYPAHLRLQWGDFSGEYHLLLVKKNTRELGISRNKYPLHENPFELGRLAWYLNGGFDLSKDLKGVPVLNLLRLASRQDNAFEKDTSGMEESSKQALLQLKYFLRDSAIQLKKTGNIPWSAKDRHTIVEPALSPVYFSLMDTIYLPTRDGRVSFAGIKKKGNDVVTATLNGQAIFDKIALNKKNLEDDLLLSPGLNILTLFADNFGNDLPSKGRMNLEFGNKKFSLDFASRKDSGATFITVKLVCDPDQSRARYFAENIPAGEDKTLEKNERLVGSIISTTQHLTLAIWDEVINDGDSISIKINGHWLVQGCPVLNSPRFIDVTLQPGANTIVFMADNLGSIPPNTSALEIIDGKRRKYYAMETKPGERNLVKIFYDTSPAP